ncbi:putative methyltransferase-domain-containing protein [Usnea florida]
MASTSVVSDTNNSVDDEDVGGQLHVLDLPQLHNKPSAQSLLSTLALLAVAPPSYTPQPTDPQPPPVNENGIPSYLTRIISSPLTWISPDTDKEAVWEAASKRLAERSGRTAIPSQSRLFSIPIDGPRTIDIALHEPSLSNDNLGHKTWLASYLLAKRLPRLLPRVFPAISPALLLPSPSPPHPPPHIIELGAGTGLLGIAAAALFHTTTHLTDLPAILPNLRANIATNRPLTSKSCVTASPLDWSSFSHLSTPEHPQIKRQTYDIILAADTLYAPAHPAWLVDTMRQLLKWDGEKRSRIVLELPLRSERPPIEHEVLRERLREAGFVGVEEGVEAGVDEWVGRGGARVEVLCWWSVWRWG